VYLINLNNKNTKAKITISENLVSINLWWYTRFG